VSVAVPTELLHQLKVKPGDRLEWRVEGSERVVRRVRSVDSLRGCVASKVPFPGLEAEKDAIRTRSGKAHKTSSQPGQSQTVIFGGEALVKSVQSMASQVHGGRQVILRRHILRPNQAKQASEEG